MSDLVKIRNLILNKEVEVYAYNPKDKNIYLNNIKDLPSNWILYPNPDVKEMELEQANLNDEKLKDFLFRIVLPNVEWIRGEKKS